MPIGNESSRRLDGLTVVGGLGVADNTGNLATVDYSRFAALARKAILQRSMGYYAETSEHASLSGTSIMVDGTVYYTLIGLLAGDVVTTMSTIVTTGGSGTTIAKMGLYSTSGTLLASTADQSTAFNSSGVKSAAVSTPYTVPADGVYYTAVFAKTGTTMPTLSRNIVNNASANAVGSGIANCGTQTAQTDLPASATITATGNVGIGFWIGIS